MVINIQSIFFSLIRPNGNEQSTILSDQMVMNSQQIVFYPDQTKP